MERLGLPCYLLASSTLPHLSIFSSGRIKRADCSLDHADEVTAHGKNHERDYGFFPHARFTALPSVREQKAFEGSPLISFPGQPLAPVPADAVLLPTLRDSPAFEV
jgi:hypothetical protein